MAAVATTRAPCPAVPRSESGRAEGEHDAGEDQEPLAGFLVGAEPGFADDIFGPLLLGLAGLECRPGTQGERPRHGHRNHPGTERSDAATERPERAEGGEGQEDHQDDGKVHDRGMQGIG